MKMLDVLFCKRLLESNNIGALRPGMVESPELLHEWFMERLLLLGIGEARLVTRLAFDFVRFSRGS